ncbi:MAG: DNA polymerase/3'-5' exonuclease PolX [Caldilineaceae bacterium]|nr:DNA polymerase/3'-5' exonuclease PolX [Caldilineaceae bacterium]
MSDSVTVTNQQAADLLDQVADRLQILDANRFRVIAFRNAAESIRNLGRTLASIQAEDGLEKIPGVGKGIADALRELLETGHVQEFDELAENVPDGVIAMMQVPDMGPKKARRLWEELDITSIEQLRAAAAAGELAQLKGFGKKSEEKILKGIELLAARQDERTPAGDARPPAEKLVGDLCAALADGDIIRIEIAGSLRRWQETIGDVDILAVSENPAAVMQAFGALPQVAEVIAAGETKQSVILTTGLQVDLRVVEARNWGAAFQYFTGSKAHNVPLRELALKRGWSLNEYGLTATGSGDAPEGEARFFSEEAALYAFLGMACPPPELRENRGEIQAAQNGRLPQLITLDDVRGELHGHTTYSDGKNTIEEMARAAMARGYGYWNVSDHSVGLGVVQGVDAEQIVRQAEEIARLNARFAAEGLDFRLLHGTEAEVLADGTMGLPDEVLATLDVVVASIHSGLRQDRDAITTRCLQVVHNPHVDILGHPTGRLIGRRAPADLDMEAVLRACAETGTVVEINANPMRLDLNDIYARRAVELGCKLAINCDAHSPADLALLRYGIGVARRAWLTPDDVINTRPVDDMLALLKR